MANRMSIALGNELKMESLDNGTVVERVIQQITNMVSAGRFKMGGRLPSEFELMEELCVSRNSLREAMKILSAMGVVDIRRGDGTYICQKVKPSVFDSVIYSMIMESSSEEEIIELRQTLDEDVLSLAIQKCSQEEIDELQDIIYQMRRHFENGELGKAAKLDYKFHMYLTQCTRNSFLSRIVTGVYKLFEGSIEKNIRTEELFANADEHHQEIVDCLRTRDESRIKQVVGNSLSSWRQNLREKI